MKKITIVITLFCIITTSVLSAVDIFDTKERTKEELTQLIHAELDNLASLEGEIRYYNSLLKHRSKAKELYESGKIAELRKLFQSHTKVLDIYFEERDYDSIKNKIGELKIIYTNFDIVSDQLLYYDAKFYSISRNEKKAQELLEKLVDEYPTSPKIDDAIFLLAEMYFKNGENEKLIGTYSILQGENSAQHKFWLGNAYFNLGKYLESTNIFKTITKDEAFGFKAKLMLALNSYFTDGVDKAIDYFSLLQDITPVEQENYPFILLCLARIYSEIDKDDIALADYEQYASLEQEYNNGIGDEILFEIATAYNNNKQYDLAIRYFTMITDKPRKSEYFASSKYYIAVAELNKGDFEGAQEGINDMIYQNQLLMDTINQKYNLLDKYQSLRKKTFDPNISEEEYIATKTKLAKVEKALETTNRLAQELYQGLNPNSLRILEAVEAEYLSYSDVVDDMDFVIHIAETKPNTRMANKMNANIDALNSDLVSLQILKYLGKKKDYKYDEFRFARSLANEKISTLSFIEQMDDIKAAAEVKHPKVVPSVEKIKELMRLNIQSIDTIAKYSFNPVITPEEKEIIAEEIKSIETNKKQYALLRKAILKNFNKKIAKKLEKQKNIFSEEFNLLRDYYDNVLTTAMEDVALENDKYKTSLLNVLFKKTQNEDEEYKALQEKIKNE